ncbi:unnamed protein product [Cuscuta europaea]|uniref:Ty3 transposon capsid-like protein domain-containing protein n=1 Tax=Cuscuta europaea TaxID=41803 RepID=A0A9P1EN55_CUSEU|nr:unnamed protein product [Cuscuta europaea]
MVRTRGKMEQRLEAVERSRTTMEEALLRMETMMQNMSGRIDTMSEDHHHRGRSRSHHSHHSRPSPSPAVSRGNSAHSNPAIHRRHDEYNRFPVHTGRKVDLPLFNGDGAYNWLVRMERYFRLNYIAEEDKLEVSVVAMEDRALNWFQWWELQTEEKNWESLKESIIRRFQPDLLQNPYGPMLSLKQAGTVEAYRDEFEMIIAPQKNVDREILRGVFLAGLKPEVKAELKLHQSRSLAEVMDMALLVEKRNEAVSVKRQEDERLGGRDKESVYAKPPRWGEGFRTRAGSSGVQNQNKTNQTWFNSAGNKETEIHSSGIKRVGPQLSQDEYQERSRKGLCFKCGEKWNREHTCKLKHYKMMLVEDSDAEEESERIDPEITEEEIVMESKSMQLSPMSKEGIPTMRAFKIKGIMKWDRGVKQVEVLIDSGATHNFISKKLVDELELPFKTISGYKVQVGNGEKLSNDGRCEDLTLCMQGSIIKQNFYFLTLEETDLVLGMEWLTTLGDVEINFRKQSIKWKIQGLDQQIQGDPHLSSMEISLKNMTPMVQVVQDTGDGYCMFYEGQSVQVKSVACAGSQDKVLEVDNIVIILGALAKSGVQDDPKYIAIEESRFTQSDARLGVIVKESAGRMGKKILRTGFGTYQLWKFYIEGRNSGSIPKITAAEISGSGLSWANEFDFVYQLGGLDIELDSTFQTVVIAISQIGHLVDLPLKQGSEKGITAARNWWGELNIHSEIMQQITGNHSSLHWQSKQEVGKDPTVSVHLLILAVVEVKGMAQVLKLKIQNALWYWVGRGAQMKMKLIIKADSYHPP